MSSFPRPQPWGKARVPAQPEPLLQGLWHHRDVILRQWPTLPLPTQAPRYGLPLPIVRQDGPNGTQLSYDVDASTVGPGPDASAAALITLWQRSEWMRSPCHACGGDMLAVAFGGILTVGGMYGVCADCFANGGRFIGGFPFALRLTHELLADAPWTLPWEPVRFTLGGSARALRAVLAELGVEGLDSDVLLLNRAVPITESRPVAGAVGEAGFATIREPDQQQDGVTDELVAAIRALLVPGLSRKNALAAEGILTEWLDRCHADEVDERVGDDPFWPVHPEEMAHRFNDDELRVAKGLEEDDLITDRMRARHIRHHLNEVLTGQGDCDDHPVQCLVTLRIPGVGRIWMSRSTSGYSFTQIVRGWEGPYASRREALDALRGGDGGFLTKGQLRRCPNAKLLRHWVRQ